MSILCKLNLTQEMIKMTNKRQNLHSLDRMMTVNSLSESQNMRFGVSMSSGYINIKQAECIVSRAENLYSQMTNLKEKIYDLYGDEQTDRLMNNFNEIIAYSDRVLSSNNDESFDSFFLKLEGFCGQIENILKMIRYYYNIFA